MVDRSSVRILRVVGLAAVLSLGLAGCDTIDRGVDHVETGAAHVANWVSGAFDHSQHETASSMPGS